MFDRRSVLAAIALAIAAPAHAQGAGAKRALLIGLDYRGTRRQLANPLNDCALIATAFRGLRFSSVETLRNPDTNSFWSDVLQFAQNVRRNDTVLIYVAGHGLQFRGENFLLLGDGALVSMSELIQPFRQNTETLVVLLDICRTDRNKPLVDGPVRQAPSPNSNVMEDFNTADLQSGTFTAFSLSGPGVQIVFSTDPNNTAADATDVSLENSPFARAFAREVVERQSFNEVIAAVTAEVDLETGGRQTPWSQGSMPREIFLAGARRNPSAPEFPVPG